MQSLNRRCLGAVLALVTLLPWAALARTPHTAQDLPIVALAELPPQGVDVYQRIHRGGPFFSDRDGVVFFNRERRLPVSPRGYYREYTVPTPGAKNRGERRIVCGGAPTRPDVCFYTADHYESFRRIAP
ncbi:MAG: hypothetical protein OHK0048_17990 [Rhodoferax sp.]